LQDFQYVPGEGAPPHQCRSSRGCGLSTPGPLSSCLGGELRARSRAAPHSPEEDEAAPALGPSRGQAHPTSVSPCVQERPRIASSSAGNRKWGWGGGVGKEPHLLLQGVGSQHSARNTPGQAGEQGRRAPRPEAAPRAREPREAQRKGPSAPTGEARGGPGGGRSKAPATVPTAPSGFRDPSWGPLQVLRWTERDSRREGQVLSRRVRPCLPASRAFRVRG